MTSTPPSTSLLQRLRRLFGAPAEGTLGSTIAASRAVQAVRDGASLLDVRERHEWKTGHPPQALHVPLGELDKAARRLPVDRPVVVVCASGMRSRSAAKRLRSLGYDAASLSGGLGAWQRAGGAVRR
ncbi:rhodanese-like domain-containing protein [Georgenia yuyongxinii]|uniref:Rhodanese-like domain-containing protein n=1 Tax=Georgenia yuyongxinii TaxID=2589797 RepID=A0A552WMU3_9MICO|nr:rhodanese-like domain-containing protein [Georgenia yuyongxinii]TRW44086.1 rhodanese-like domain-containing protein [Georgenia yuyongxinii]